MNHVFMENGSVTGNVNGGIASGKASENTVDIKGGTVTGQIYGGDGDAEATGNIVTITKGTTATSSAAIRRAARPRAIP